MEWSPSPSSGVVGYKAYYGTATHTFSTSIYVGATTNATISGLAEGVKHFFVVTAINAAGNESLPSNEISHTVPWSAAGRYDGLFYVQSGIQEPGAGSVTISVTKRGTYSGRLKIGSRRYSFSGRLNSEGQANNTITRRGANPLTVQLDIGVNNQSDAISGYVTDGTWVSVMTADRAVFNARANPAPVAGNYTVAVVALDADPAAPTGIGYGTVRVNRNGVVRFVGALADGTRVSQGVPLSKAGVWPLYIPLYHGKGLIAGWVGFTNEINSDLDGVLSWIKTPDPRARYYSSGFTNNYRVIGSVYQKPVGPGGRIVDLTNANLGFSGGNLAADFTNSVVLGLNNKVSNVSSNRLTMRFARSSGWFTGKVTDPATSRLLSFRGAVLQKRNVGYGFLLGTDQSSSVALTP